MGQGRRQRREIDREKKGSLYESFRVLLNIFRRRYLKICEKDNWLFLTMV